jgi:hypothetical protein
MDLIKDNECENKIREKLINRFKVNFIVNKNSIHGNLWLFGEHLEFDSPILKFVYKDNVNIAYKEINLIRKYNILFIIPIGIKIITKKEEIKFITNNRNYIINSIEQRL